MATHLSVREGKTKRKRRWATLKAAELSLYKSYRDSTAAVSGVVVKVKKLPMAKCQVLKHREKDDDYGFYMQVRTTSQNTIEMWAETLKDYELWLESLGKLAAGSSP
jgi:hypothetical protein